MFRTDSFGAGQRVSLSALLISLFFLAAALGVTPALAQSTGNKCGNGIVDSGEQCDKAIDYGGGRTCDTSCRWRAQCGNGYVEGAEECYDGANNSDSTPGACRTSCRLAFCGDSVTDTGRGEQCDDGAGNNNKIPGACRGNCRLPSCGDGVVDFPTGEQCEAGMGDSRMACFSCQSCTPVTDNLVLNQSGKYVNLCESTYSVTDSGAEGVIRVTGNGMVINCNGATIAGAGDASVLQRVDPKVSKISPKQLTTRPGTKGTKSTTPKSSAPEPSSSQPARTPVPVATYTRGTGILVTGSGNTLINCKVENFRNGIKFTGTGNVLIGSDMCRNSAGIVAAASTTGARNSCKGTIANWAEDGTSCSESCQ